MEKQILDFAVTKTHELMEAFSCHPDVKAAAQAWLDAVGTGAEAEETKRYLAMLEDSIVPIDMLINLADSPEGAKIFGDHAPEVASHAREIKAAGALYCDCPACAACEAILNRKEEMLK